jgi:hypothetical protein
VSGQTPLHWAARLGNKGVVELLLRNGANKDAKAADGDTPLHRAAEGGHEGVVQLLLSSGADKDAKTSSDHTPLHLAAEGGHEGVVDLLLGKGANKDAKAADGDTPLHLAARLHHEGVVDLLLSSGEDKDAPTAANPRAAAPSKAAIHEVDMLKSAMEVQTSMLQKGSSNAPKWRGPSAAASPSVLRRTVQLINNPAARSFWEANFEDNIVIPAKEFYVTLQSHLIDRLGLPKWKVTVKALTARVDGEDCELVTMGEWSRATSNLIKPEDAACLAQLLTAPEDGEEDYNRILNASGVFIQPALGDRRYVVDEFESENNGISSKPLAWKVVSLSPLNAGTMDVEIFVMRNNEKSYIRGTMPRPAVKVSLCRVPGSQPTRFHMGIGGQRIRVPGVPGYVQLWGIDNNGIEEFIFDTAS